MTPRQKVLAGKVLAGIVLLAAVVVGGTYLFTRARTGPSEERESDTVAVSKPAAKPVVTAELLEVDRVSVDREFTGTIENRRTTTLSFEESGRIVDIDVDDGARVVQGQRLATLDTRRLNARKRRVQADLGQAQAFLEELVAGPRSQTIEAAKAEIQVFEAQIALQESTLERRRRLLRVAATTDQDVDDVASQLQVFQAQRAAAAARLAELLEGTRTEKIVAQEAVVSGLQADLDDIDVQIDQAQLTAPFAGRVVKRHLDPGAMAMPNMTVLELAEDQHLEVRLGLPLSLSQRMAVGDELRVTGAQGAGVATIRALIPRLNSRTRTQTVVLDLDGSTMVAGELVSVHVSDSLPIAGLQVPASALLSGRKGLWSVFVVNSLPAGRTVVERRDVEILHTDGSLAVIRGAVAAGERVVSRGAHRVVHGDFVSIAPPQSESVGQTVQSSLAR